MPTAGTVPAPSVTVGPLGRLRRLGRYRRIARLLLAHGLDFAAAEALPQGLYSLLRREPPPSREVGVRVRRLLEDLGPTFVKLGQLLSTRPDLVPADVLRELERLQDHVPPESPERIRQVLESEMGRPVEVLFSSFRWDPVASASLGQVHEATLPSGEEVVVKVQRPGVRDVVEADLAILTDVFLLMGQLPGLRDLMDTRQVAEEFARSLRAELDYTREARNAERMAYALRRNPQVVVPRVYWDYTRSRILTMQRVQGLKPTSPQVLREAGQDPQELVRALVTAILDTVFREGFFHADPHPGNLVVLADGRLALLDFGMVGRLSPAMRDAFGDLSLALLRGDSEAVLEAILHMGALPKGLDRERLLRDIEDLRDRYYQVPFRQLHLSQVVQDIFGVAYRHRIRIPTDLTLLAKCLVTLEGVASQLSPEMSLLEVARPFGFSLWRQRLSPRRQLRQAQRTGRELWSTFLSLPQDVRRLVVSAAEGDVRLTLRSENLSSDKTLRRMAHALTLAGAGMVAGLVAGALIVAAALRPSLVPSPWWPGMALALAALLFALALWRL